MQHHLAKKLQKAIKNNEFSLTEEKIRIIGSALIENSHSQKQSISLEQLIINLSTHYKKNQQKLQSVELRRVSATRLKQEVNQDGQSKWIP